MEIVPPQKEMKTLWTIEQIRNQFILITQARSGTQLVERALETHPDIVIRSWNVRDTNGVMALYGFRALDNEYEAKARFRGTSTHQWGEEFIRNITHMEARKFWKVVSYFFPRAIILNRENQLRRYLSHKVASIKGFSVAEPRNGHPVIDLDIGELIFSIQYTIANQMATEEAFPDAKIVEYEDLLNNWEQTIGDIQAFIGAEVLPLQPITHRWETRPVSEIINNWDRRLERRLQKLGYGGWLDGP